MSVLYLRRRAAPTQAFLLGVQALMCGFLVVFALLHPTYIDSLLWVLVALWGVWAGLASVLAAWHVLGEESVAVDASDVHARLRIGPLRRDQTQALVDVVDVKLIQPTAEARLNDMWGLGQARVSITGSRKTMRVALASSLDQAEVLVTRLRAAISQARDANAGEAPSNNKMQQTRRG
jgi:hypothetical protein